MKRRDKKAHAHTEAEPKGPRIYRHDPTTDLWKGEDGFRYHLFTHGTKPAHLDLRKEW